MLAVIEITTTICVITETIATMAITITDLIIQTIRIVIITTIITIISVITIFKKTGEGPEVSTTGAEDSKVAHTDKIISNIREEEATLHILLRAQTPAAGPHREAQFYKIARNSRRKEGHFLQRDHILWTW